MTGSVTSTNQWFLELAALNEALHEGEALGEFESQPEESPPTYIHLSNARYVVGGPTPLSPTAGGALFRARLSDVSGWALGTAE